MFAVVATLALVLLSFSVAVIVLDAIAEGRFGIFPLSPREGVAFRSREWTFFGKQVITNPFANHVPYLTRYIIVRCPWFRIFLHRFHGPDPDRHLHNHPWRAVSIILKGGYLEIVSPFVFWAEGDLEDLTFTNSHRGFGKVNRLAWDAYHKISRVHPGTWSLVLGGAYKRDWGFLVDGEHVPWRTYLDLAPSTKLED